MQKVLEYERHAAECRQMATATKNLQNKKQLWERLAAPNLG
jgi:hypothetical protein